ncbi:hypothetical protein [Arthrobacter sp. ES3-54]|uniref:hypothetical protein n=1 Tax=Arthrobacter sp. ES3-54 TaxID=1502991 RepID=UPI002406CD2E|nr:hypothetical protein [Arthrobacter sp. ES3-54]MDF9749193.1 hypothetical protein [Arthrobacter sp. ES3-54]
MALEREYQIAIRRSALFATLEKDVIEHQLKIAQLRERIRIAEDEIELHEVVLELTRNRRLIDAISEFSDVGSSASNFVRDPLQYCREENIPLPEGVTLYPPNSYDPSHLPTARVRRGMWDMEIIWDGETGFLMRPYHATVAATEIH